MELFSQIKIHELPPSHSGSFDSLYSQSFSEGEIIPLHNGWTAYVNPESGKKAKITLPSSFTGGEFLTYEKQFQLDSIQVLNNEISLVCLGVGYEAEFILNDNVVQKIRGGEVPFKVNLPEDLLRIGDKNELVIKVNNKLDAFSSIPLKPRFLFGKRSSGIFRDIYLELVPKLGIKDLRIATSSTDNFKTAELQLNFNTNREVFKQDDNERYADVKLITEIFQNTNKTNPTYTFTTILTDSSENIINLLLENPQLWSPENPNFYSVSIKLSVDNKIIQKTNRKIIFYNLKQSPDQLTLNGKKLEIKGTSHFCNNPERNNLVTLSEIETQIKNIKSLGFNTVRFNKSVPHPYALDLCLTNGLFVILEVPLNSMPEPFSENEKFVKLNEEYIKNLIRYSENYGNVLALGVGSGFIANSESHDLFVSKMCEFISKNSRLNSFASFIGYPSEEIENLDFLGLEIFYPQIKDNNQSLSTTLQKFGKKRVLFSEVTAPAFRESTNGYSNPFSYESQAKFFKQVIDLGEENDLMGTILNSFMDYSGDFASFYAGHNSENLYKIGITDKSGKEDRISSALIKSEFNNTEKVIVPLGNYKEDSPIFFIILSLGLSVVLAIIINSKRKFREDATRALTKPYNFYADIRDNRILTGFHSFSLLIILAASHALLFTILLFFFRSNVLVEKILLSFGNNWLPGTIAELSWNPTSTFFKLFIVAIILFAVITILVKIASLSIKNKVSVYSIFIVVVWSFLPVVLLLPLELILFKVLSVNIINVWLYLFFILYAIWLYQRLLKGIYVIFDVHPIKVYFYGLVTLVLIAGGFVLYYQLSNATIYYIINAYKQYQLM